MIISFIYVILAILGLSFLIFIHELGHYWMARRVGMRVETFAIGFGKPIYTWERDGVKWQVGWLLFGGYVKIAGMETEDGKDLYDIPDGFFGKRPWDRIKVAFMGPFVNLVFALLLFTFLWTIGGREKNFSEFTHTIGWIDPHSELYADGVRPGDVITGYNDWAYHTSKDNLYAAMVSPGNIDVKGLKVNYKTGKKTPFEYKIKPYPNPLAIDSSILTTGVLDTANYIIYNKLPNGKDNPLPEGSPLIGSGIHYGDRILWVDGQLVFSSAQLSHLLNDDRILLTVKRGDETFLSRVPRVEAQELRPDAEFREELVDWQYEAGLKDKKFQDLYVIPYNLTHDGVVENVLRFIDKGDQKNAFPPHLFSKIDDSLQPGDKIIAVQGEPVAHAYQIIKGIQSKKANLIVLNSALEGEVFSSEEADSNFDKNFKMSDLEKIAASIGTENRIAHLGNLSLLKPIVPKARTDFPMSEQTKAWLATEKSEQKKVIEEVEDPEKRQHLLSLLEANEKLLVLGLPNPQDKKVAYNPTPIQLFDNVLGEIWRTLRALFTGTLSPKFMTGPVGIVQIVYDTSKVSFRDTLFWIGAISLNLGILNLLPIPVLDGGNILFSFFEMVTGRRLKPKTLEKVVIVFAVLLISFFIFLTYNDILRVFGTFLS